MERITIKELAVKLNLGRTATQKLYAEIKAEYNTRIVTMAHVRDYLHIPHAQNHG